MHWHYNYELTYATEPRQNAISVEHVFAGQFLGLFVEFKTVRADRTLFAAVFA